MLFSEINIFHQTIYNLIQILEILHLALLRVIMLFSILIYATLIFVMGGLSYAYAHLYPSRNVSKKNILIFTSIIFYSIIMGCRYGVGTDYFNYLEDYEDIKYFDPNWTEYIFSSFTLFLSKNNIHYAIYFGLIAFFQILFFINVYKRFPRILPFAIIFFFIGSYYLGWNNVLRQNLVVAIFLNMISLVEKRNFCSYFLITLLCIGIHASGLLLLFIYPLLRIIEKHNITLTTNIQVAIYLFFIGCGLTLDIFSFIYNNEFFLLFLLDTDYASYAWNDGIMTAGSERSLGLGYVLKLTNRLIIILYSNKLLSYYKIPYFKYSYWLYFIGICFHALFTTSIVLQRPNLYFLSFDLIITPFLWFYLLHKKEKYSKFNIFLFCFSIASYILMFLSEIANGKATTAEFHFFFAP